ncbi:MAG: mandelate racemase/muconate lactonizing enzyme family protein [Opitutus sp.]
MFLSRRRFISHAAVGSVAAAVSVRAAESRPQQARFPAATDEALYAAAARPVLEVRHLIKEPVIIEAVELLTVGRQHFVRVRAKGGADGLSLDNGRMRVLHPILTQLIAPYLIGRDARDLEEHLFEIYRRGSNYKLQGLAFWSPVALVEFAVLDLLGRVANRSIHQLLGPQVRERVPFYIASGRRDTTPEQEVEYLQKLIADTGAKAVKYRLGGRMSRNQDALPNRTERLIPLTRKVLGDRIAIHGDANSSYDAREAIRIGRMLEDINAVYFEEPCPFDDFVATKKVTDALTIPVSLGEQESSEARFLQQIRDHVADIVQPDLFYYGGLIRSIRVARMAALRNMPAIAHISGGFGFVYMLHFAAVVPDIGPWQEYKNGVETYGQWFNPGLKIIDGALTVPSGPGVGIANPKEILKDATAFKG